MEKEYLNKDDFVEYISELIKDYFSNENSDEHFPDYPVKQFDEISFLNNAICDKLVIDRTGKPVGELISTLKEIGRLTPRVDGKRYLAQLFSGKNNIVLLADMLATLYNVPMHTLKSSGIHIKIEEEVIKYVNQFTGFDDGIMCPGGSISNLIAVVIARYKKTDSKQEGISDRYRLYVSENAHYSIKMSAEVTGIGARNIVFIRTDSNEAMVPEELENNILKDLSEGFMPLIVISTAGTTQFGSFDNLVENDKIAKKYGLWHHVDGAFGATVLFSSKRNYLMNGLSSCDSLTWDFHKMLSAPISASLLLTKKQDLKLLDQDAYYLFTHADDPGRKTIQCARRNDALKMWALLNLGQEFIEQRIDYQVDLAKYAFELFSSVEYLELAVKPVLPVVMFRHKYKDIYQILSANGYKCGRGRFKDKEWVKISFINSELTKKDIDLILKLIIQD